MTTKSIEIEKINASLCLWISDADFWKEETINNQKKLEENFSKINDTEEAKRLDYFQNQITYYRDKLLPELSHDLIQLKDALEKEADLKTLMKQFHLLEERTTLIHEQMKERRRQLILFENNI